MRSLTGAFTYCDSLTSIEIPESVLKIEIKAFANCNNLESIKLTNAEIHYEYVI